MKRSPDVDACIAKFPPSVRTRLRRLRSVVRKNAPKAQEIISYRIPAYRGNGILVFFAGFKAHIGQFPPVRGDAGLEKTLRPYSGPKGNLKFPHADPLPLALIARIVRLRVRQDRANKKGR